MGGSSTVALTIGGIVSFLLNAAGFLPLLIQQIEPTYGLQLRQLIVSLIQNIGNAQVSSFSIWMFGMIPTSILLGFVVWVVITLVIAGFFAALGPLKGLVVGGIIGIIIILYMTGQFNALFNNSPSLHFPTNSTGGQ